METPYRQHRSAFKDAGSPSIIVTSVVIYGQVSEVEHGGRGGEPGEGLDRGLLGGGARVRQPARDQGRRG